MMVALRMNLMEIKDKLITKEYNEWKIIGLCSLCIRFVQGWIFWGGGSRRFIYDPLKLDPYTSDWMANKLQSAMPGALFDLSSVVGFLLQHFVILYTAIILFSLVELLSGLGLILGLFTRASAMLTVLVSIILMILFGWQGGTCLDEWTMAVSNLSMGLTLFLMGGSAYSLDAWLIKKRPLLKHKSWFLLLNTGPWSKARLEKSVFIFLIFTVLFTVGTYNYFRGAVFSPYHSGPISATEFHLRLSKGQLQSNGSLSFTLEVDSGTSSVPSYIVRIELVNEANRPVEIWTAPQLSKLPKSAINNSYEYNKVSLGPYGIVAPESSKAVIVLKLSSKIALIKDHYTLQIYTIDGKRWDLNEWQEAKKP